MSKTLSVAEFFELSKKNGKQSKYRNKPVTVEGLRFDSKAETKRWAELNLLYRAGKIDGLLRQQRYVLAIEGVKICTWVADFVYRENGKWCAEDVKSPATAKNRAYRIKAKLFQALYPDIELREVKA